MPLLSGPADDLVNLTETTPLEPVYSPRVARVTLDIFSGGSTLTLGGELASRLWNQARTQQEQHFQQTGRYLHLFELQKTLRRQQGKLRLSDRCFSFVLRRYQGNLATWLKNRQVYPKGNPPGVAAEPQPLLFEVGRNAFPIHPWTYRLTILKKGIPERYAVIKIRARPGVKMEQVKLIQVQSDLTGLLTYYLKLQQKSPGKQIAGIDLGIYNLATVAFQSGESIQYSGQGILELDQSIKLRIKPSKSVDSSTPKNSQPSKKRQARLRKVKNIRWLAIHNLTHNIVHECLKRQVGVIVIGDLTHIRQGKNRRILRTWSYRQITEQLTYKAAEIGIQVIPIKEWYTSQLCHRCGVRGKRIQKGRLFRCQQCHNLLIDADVNGAFNILNRYKSVPALAQLELSNNWAVSTEATPKKVGAIKRPYFGPTYFATFAKNYTITLRRNDGL